jgi:ribonuclease HIII
MESKKTKKESPCSATVYPTKTLIIQGKNTPKKRADFLAKIEKELSKIDTNQIRGICELTAMTFS